MNDSETHFVSQELFKFLEPAERELLLENGEKISLKKGQILTRQGDPADSFFIVLTGRLRITKHAKNKTVEHKLAYLNPGDTIGEMALIENVQRGFTLKAVKSTTLIKFPVETIKKFPEIYNKLGLYLGRRTAERLRYLSDVTVKSMEKELQASKKQRAFGMLMVTVLSLISAYMIGLRFLEKVNTLLPISTIISGPLVIIIAVIILIVMKRSEFSWKTYGISLDNWQQDILDALLFSIPVIIILMIAKWILIHFILKNPHIPMIDPQNSMNHSFNITLYLISLFVYILLVPLQELVSRGALQTGFYLFLPGTKKKRLWTAIIISNLIFSLPHLYHSVYFALIVLIPGIFWGWLFARQKTLVGVTVSHLFIGVWMVFVVGFEQLLTQLA